MLYSQTIKNLVSGISQQPPVLRLPEQLAEQINGFSTETSGLQKRPPTCFVKKLGRALEDTKEPLVHFVSRDKQEKYFMYFYDNTIKIYDLDGNQKTVKIENDGSYLATNNPRDDLRVLTVADYTFIVNRQKTVKMTGKYSPNYFQTQGALVHIKQGQYGRTYSVWINDKLAATFSTPDGSDKSHSKMIDTHYIAEQLATNARSNGYTVDVGNTWLRFHNATSVTTQDCFNNQAMIGFVSTAQKFSLLPETAPNHFTVKIAGDPNNGTGSYYVEYSTEDAIWKETVRPNIQVEIDPSTMPHGWIRNADGTFSFRQTPWGERAVGDEDSNPLPSFIGEKFNDVFFYRNRLGFLAGENVIMSESAEYFNFFMTTANDVLDTDPIDISTTTANINILLYAIPFNEQLYCFSDSTQFIVSSDTTLSPKNVALVNVTAFNSAPNCRPTVCGKNMYFASARSEYSSIKEYYYVPSATEMRNAQDITAHVSSYIPNDVYAIIPSTNENIMLFLTDGDKQSIYIYKYLFQNENRVQASWSKWDMGGEVFGCGFVGSTLYVLLNRGGNHVLEKMLFTYNTLDLDDEPYRVYLDSKKKLTHMTYDNVYEKTHVDIKNEYSLSDFTNPFGIVLHDGTYIEWTADEVKNSNGVVQIDGDHTKENIIIGVPYTFRIDMSPVYIRTEDKSGTVKAVTNGRLQVRDIKINYADTGSFVVYVTSHGHTYTYRMTAKPIGQTILGKVQSATGEFRVPVQCLNTSYTMHLVSDMPLPVSLVGMLWEGSWRARAKEA